MRSLSGRLRDLRGWFYRGPRFLGVEPYRRNGYQSPTATAVLWVYALLVRNVTMAGIIVLLCGALVSFYALFSLMMPIYFLAFSIFSLLVLDVIIGYVVRPKVTVTRELPERIGCGGRQLVRYAVTNGGRTPVWDLFLDGLPLPRGLEFPDGRAHIEELRPGETVHLLVPLGAKRRGRYVIPAARADSAFPFHLWRWGVLGEGARVLMVQPAFTRLRRLRLASGMRYQAGGLSLSAQVGQSMEFLGAREFRLGDNPRHIHWRSWARTGTPVVKEFREEFLCRTALVVDTSRPVPYFWEKPFRLPDPTLEAGLSLAAALAEFFSDSDYVIDLFAAGPNVYRFRGGRGRAFLAGILDVLACVEPYHGEPFAEFSEELREEIVQISSAVFVLLTWDETRRELI